jgi:ATP-dependent Clp protease ATP-binding subunit ClpC
VGKVNVYLPDDLERAVKEAGIPLSSVCQVALRAAVERVGGLRSATDPAAAMGAITPRLAEVLAHVPADPTRDDGRGGPVELLGAIVLHGENLGARVLRDLGLELPVRKRVRRSTGLTDEARAVLAGAVRAALELRQDLVGTEHVVLALAGDPTTADLFGALGVDERAVRARIERLVANPWRNDAGAESAGAAGAVPPAALLDRFEAELRRLGDELRALRGE